MPVRIQRRRTRGWRMPEGAVYVGRPGPWGNPFILDPTLVLAVSAAYGYPARGSAWEWGFAMVLHRWWLTGEPPMPAPESRLERGYGPGEFTEGRTGGAFWMPGLSPIPLPLRPSLEPLRGRDLACWCPLDDPLRPCHADTLLRLANA